MIRYIIKTTGGYPYWRADNPADTVHFDTPEEAQAVIDKLSETGFEMEGAEVVAYDVFRCHWGQHLAPSCGVELEPIAAAYLLKTIQRLRCPGCGRLVMMKAGG